MGPSVSDPACLLGQIAPSLCYPNDGEAIAYATVHAKGRRAQVCNPAGRLIHDSRKTIGENQP